ncbi:MAG: hypothetical protein C0606_07570 [Hyphomicrobiales bacterium]|nr:MAG: hypothetical protein C0606_07570 [Hyphomicrobiales bacterium]
MLTKAAFTSIALFAALVPGAASADLFNISEPVVSAGTSGAPGYAPTRLAERVGEAGAVWRMRRPRELWISFTVLGGPKALAFLESKKRLDVDVELSCDGVLRERKISIGINANMWWTQRDGLRFEFQRDGYFTWRTRAATDRLRCREIQFRILDGFRSVISPIGDTSTYVVQVEFM